MTDYLEEIKGLIKKQFDLDDDLVQDDSFLEADLNITELDLEDFVAQIEDKYHVSIPQEIYSKFKQVTDIADYLYENVDRP